MSELTSNKNYVVDMPTLGAFGTVSKVQVDEEWANAEEHTGEDNEFDAVILSGKKASISFDYTYISGVATTPTDMLDGAVPVTLTDDSEAMLPGKVLITKVTTTAEKGKERTASCEGMWMPFFDTLS